MSVSRISGSAHVLEVFDADLDESVAICIELRLRLAVSA